MAITKCPCYCCPNRKVSIDYNCHSHCEKYKEYRVLQEKATTKERQNAWSVRIGRNDYNGRR